MKKKGRIKIGGPILAGKRWTGCLLYFMMTVYPEKVNQKKNTYVWTVGPVCNSHYMQIGYMPVFIVRFSMPLPTYYFNYQVWTMENYRHWWSKKERSYIFSEYCTKISKANFLRYVNEVWFEMVKTDLNDTYSVATVPQHYNMRSLHAQKWNMIKRLGLW